MRFSHHEVKDLWIAGIFISLAFAVLLSGGYNAIFSFNAEIGVYFIISLFTAGIGFLLHEIMHKFVAQNYGLWAEFRAFYNMLWLALLFSFFGFIFAAPGAVVIRGKINREKYGKISLAGPMTNIVLALLFLMGVLILGKTGIRGLFFSLGLTINSLLAAFNMIPTMPFDGAKILMWHKGIYFITTILAVGLFVISFFA